MKIYRVTCSDEYDEAELLNLATEPDGTQIGKQSSEAIVSHRAIAAGAQAA